MDCLVFRMQVLHLMAMALAMAYDPNPSRPTKGRKSNQLPPIYSPVATSDSASPVPPHPCACHIVSCHFCGVTETGSLSSETLTPQRILPFPENPPRRNHGLSDPGSGKPDSHVSSGPPNSLLFIAGDVLNVATSTFQTWAIVGIGNVRTMHSPVCGTVGETVLPTLKESSVTDLATFFKNVPLSLCLSVACPSACHSDWSDRTTRQQQCRVSSSTGQLAQESLVVSSLCSLFLRLFGSSL